MYKASINLIFILLLVSIQGCNQKSNLPAPAEKLNSTVYAKVHISVPEKYLMPITAGMEGKIEKLYFQHLDTVKKGDFICLLSNPEYLTIQKEYLRLKYQLEFEKEEFKRQGDLNFENFSSMKKMQKVQNEYLSTYSECEALEKSLQLIGFNPQTIFKKGPQKFAVITAKATGQLYFTSLNEHSMLKSTGNNHFIITKDTLVARMHFSDFPVDQQQCTVLISTGIKDVELNFNEFNQVQISNDVYFESTIPDIDMLKHGMLLNGRIKNNN